MISNAAMITRKDNLAHLLGKNWTSSSAPACPVLE